MFSISVKKIGIAVLSLGLSGLARAESLINETTFVDTIQAFGNVIVALVDVIYAVLPKIAGLMLLIGLVLALLDFFTGMVGILDMVKIPHMGRKRR
jgi:hypothetical protein